MTPELDPFDDGRPKRKRARKARDLGRLHSLLIRGLPDWVDEDGLLRVYELAKYLSVSYQSVYAFLGRERIPQKRLNAIIRLSEQSKNGGDDFVPLTHGDFAEFLG